jgi:hypothetical protein
MARGVLIAESLRLGATLDVPLTVARIERVDPGELSDAQREAGVPERWTLLHFDVADEHLGNLAPALAAALDDVGWYADFRTDEETWVVYAGCVFRYPRGDANGRAAAIAHGRSRGVPEAQLDWPV